MVALVAAALAGQERGTLPGLSCMLNGHPARHVTALALVGGAHAAALLLLVTLTRTQLLHVSPEVSPLFVIMLPPLPSKQPAAPASAPTSHELRPRPAASAAAEPAPMPLPPVQAPSGLGAIDWTGDAAAAAAQEARNDEEARRKAGAFALRPNAAFVQRTPTPEFHWYHARTHRVEPLDGGGTVINLTDECRLIVLVLVPLPTCDLEKTPARGDLFEHMRDAPELGAWRER